MEPSNTTANDDFLCGLSEHEYFAFGEPPGQDGTIQVTWRCRYCQALHPECELENG
jgi:hypothetical protein